MTARLLLTNVLWLHAFGATPSAQHPIGRVIQPRLRVDLAFEGLSLRPRLAASAIDEISRVWAPYGVDVHACSSGGLTPDGGVRIAVRLTGHPDRGDESGVLGSIRFQGGVPEPAIVMYLDAIATLVSTVTINETRSRSWPADLRDLVVGRALGRALAHELGHFLLSSQHHAAAGLMAPLQAAPDLVSPGRQRFTLNADEVRRLMVATSTAAQSSAAAAFPIDTASP